jgi:hypothetical protein
MQTDQISGDEVRKSEPANDQPGTVCRGDNGRFLPGNRTGQGNPHAKRVAQLKAECLAAVENGDLTDVIKRLIADAKGGEVAAAKVLLDRIFGKEVIATVISDSPVMQVLLLPRNGTESGRERPPG